MRPFIVLITQYYHLDTKDPNFKLLERFTVGFHDKTSNGTSLNEARKENVQQEEQDPGEYTTHTGKCSNPTLLIFSTRKITDMKIQAPSSLTFYSFASYFYDSIYISHPGSTNKVVCVYYRSPCYNTFSEQSTKAASGTQACAIGANGAFARWMGLVRWITSGNLFRPRSQKHEKSVSSF